MRHFSPTSSMIPRFCILLAIVLASALARTSFGIATHHLSTGEDPADYVKRKIDTHDVMVFTRSYGPHNRYTKELLRKMQNEIKIEVEFVDIDLLPGFDGSLIMMELQRINGQWALPNIYIGKNHVGGNTELEQLEGIGELESMLKSVAAAEL